MALSLSVSLMVEFLCSVTIYAVSLFFTGLFCSGHLYTFIFFWNRILELNSVLLQWTLKLPIQGSGLGL